MSPSSAQAATAAKSMTEALLKTGKRTITAIARSSTSPRRLWRLSLKDQDALVITLGAFAQQGVQDCLIDAAGEGGIHCILPNEWSPDSAHEGLGKDVAILGSKGATRKYIQSQGRSAFISVVTGFWGEWSLATFSASRFDFASKSVTFLNEGQSKISTSTWPQVGRAVAALLSLPINSEADNESACLTALRDKIVYINSFTISQQDIFDSILRVTGDSSKVWTVTKTPSSEQYTNGISKMQNSDQKGFMKMMYTRVFYPDGCGDFESGRGILDNLLGLPKEDLDEATERVTGRFKQTQSAFERAISQS